MDAQGIFQCVILFLLFITEWDAEITWTQLQQAAPAAQVTKTPPFINALHFLLKSYIFKANSFFQSNCSVKSVFKFCSTWL